MSSPAYMAEPWFELLASAARERDRQTVAQMLGVSPPVVTQVLNGTGHYGSGKASTARLAERVRQVFGWFECPHLTAQFETPRLITGPTCAEFALTRPPVGSPGAMEHWRACQKCPRRALAQLPGVAQAAAGSEPVSPSPTTSPTTPTNASEAA